MSGTGKERLPCGGRSAPALPYTGDESVEAGEAPVAARDCCSQGKPERVGEGPFRAKAVLKSVA